MPEKNKRGVSELVSYVLLIVFVLAMAIVAYQWLKTYVPKDTLTCPDGVSIFVKEGYFNSTTSKLTLTVNNNGRYDLAGFFIHATNSSNQEEPKLDLSIFLNATESPQAINHINSVIFVGIGQNMFKINEERSVVFNIPASIGNISKIRVTPVRFQDQDNKLKFASCGDAKTQGFVGDTFECEPTNPNICSGKECGQWWNGCEFLICPPNNCLSYGSDYQCNLTGQCECVDSRTIQEICGERICGDTINNCGQSVSCGNCTSPATCNATGQCVGGASCTPDPNVCSNNRCGLWVNGTNCGNADCGDCSSVSGYYCNSTAVNNGYCVPLCGNGVLNAGEECDDRNTVGGDGCSNCLIDDGYTCVGQPSVCTIETTSCQGVCLSLGYNFTSSGCTSSPGTCSAGGGVHISEGDTSCESIGDPQADTCCCKN